MTTESQRRTWRRESTKRSLADRRENSPTVSILDSRVLVLLDEIEALEKTLGG